MTRHINPDTYGRHARHPVVNPAQFWWWISAKRTEYPSPAPAAAGAHRADDRHDSQVGAA